MGGIVGSIIGAVVGSKAAGKASGQLVAAGKESLAFQREIFETTEANAAPFIEGGGLGLEALLFKLGLGDAPIVGGTTKFKVSGREFDTRAAAEDFAKAIPGTRSSGQTREVTFFSKEGDPQVFRVADDTVTGGRPARGVEEFTTGGIPFAGFQESPGFKFAFQKGVDAVDASAAAGGGLFSGSTLEDLTKFGQGFASQERGTFLNRLQSLVSVGQAGVGQVAGAGSVFAQGGSQTIEGIGNAQSAGVIGVANARAQQLNSLGTTLGGVASLFGDFSGLFSSSFAPQTSPTPVSKPLIFNS